MDYEGRLNAAMEAARQSGAMLVRREGFHTDRKAAKDFVTDMDRASERIIIDKLNALYPEDGFFGEEGGLRREADGVVTGWDKGDDPLVSGNVLATNSLMHGFFAERLTLKGPAC